MKPPVGPAEKSYVDIISQAMDEIQIDIINGQGSS